MWRRVILVRTDVSEESSVFIIRLIRIGELGRLGVASNRRTLLTLLLTHRFLSPWWWRRYVPAKRRFLHGVTSQKTTFFTVTAVKTSQILQRELAMKKSHQVQDWEKSRAFMSTVMKISVPQRLDFCWVHRLLLGAEDGLWLCKFEAN
jgi:hypothetical protein